ncbi:MAG TPA: epoxyqueuosine reductase QueH [Clostridiales bacterium]|nr:epoxyqueuosine reductase QueH [Clostridiales bacterium]
MEKINYQLILDKKLKEIIGKGSVPTLLLHSCCAPCSSYVLEYLSEYFNIIILFYNPNIMPFDEYNRRLEEQKRLVSEMKTRNSVEIIEGEYNIDDFLDVVKGLEDEPEGGARCEKCFRLRLNESAVFAKRLGADYFTTTLTVSPHKNSQIINAIGNEVSEKFGVEYLQSDFKKRNGYKRSIELAKQYDLYRQDYCGCVYT